MIRVVNAMKSMIAFLTQIAPGRVVLHLGCLLRGGHWRFHWNGVKRQMPQCYKNKHGSSYM